DGVLDSRPGPVRRAGMPPRLPQPSGPRAAAGALGAGRLRHGFRHEWTPSVEERAAAPVSQPVAIGPTTCDDARWSPPEDGRRPWDARSLALARAVESGTIIARTGGCRGP